MAEQPTAIAFVDIEAGGLRHDAQPWEVALITRAHDGTEKRYRWFNANFSVATADPAALTLADFWNRHPAVAPPADGVEAELAALTRDEDLPDGDLPILGGLVDERLLAMLLERFTRGAVLVACNPYYDAPRLQQLLLRHHLADTWHYRPYCATTAAAAFLRGRGVDPGPPPFSNAVIGALLGVDRDAFGPPHSGLADAYYARALYDAVNTAPLPAGVP